MSQVAGEHHYRARLTADKVRRIRAAYFPPFAGYGRLAKEFGVGESTIRDVITYRTWRHVI